jgi:hypothetical protein
MEINFKFDETKEQSASSTARDFFLDYHNKKQQEELEDFFSQQPDSEPRADEAEG